MSRQANREHAFASGLSSKRARSNKLLSAISLVALSVVMVLSLSPWAQAASAFADNEANLSLSTGVDAAISDSEDATVENATADATEDNANVGTTANDATIEDDAQDGEVAEEGSNGAAVAKAQAVDAPAADSASETTNDATATDSTNYVIDGTKSIADLLGEARFYGIVANQWRVSES